MIIFENDFLLFIIESQKKHVRQLKVIFFVLKNINKNNFK